MKEKMKLNIIEDHNTTDYTAHQVLFAIEKNDELDEKRIEYQINEASDWLDEHLLGSEGIEEYAREALREGSFGQIADSLIPYINIDQLASSLREEHDEDEHDNVYRCE